MIVGIPWGGVSNIHRIIMGVLNNSNLSLELLCLAT